MKSVLFTFIVTVMVISLSLSQERQSLEEQEVFRNVSRLPGSNAFSSDYDVAIAVAVDNQGNVYVTGSSWGDSLTKIDYATVKYDASGNEQWVARFNGPGNFDDTPYALAVDDSGNVYVTGESFWVIGNGYDYTTIKYNASGEEQWVARFNGPANRHDRPQALAVDGSGNVYVTGAERLYDWGSYATVKYNASGEEQWVAYYDGPGFSWDWAYALAVDGVGNVYVTGSSGEGTAFDYATVKYNASGVEQWVARYNGPENSTDRATALAVDGAGSVYVTGSSEDSISGYDYATVKYNASGEEQWVGRYNGPGNSTDGADALAMDGAGTLYVTGLSKGSGSGYDYLTIKYSAATGDTLWARRYNGPANSDDLVTAMAVDDSGYIHVTGRSQGINFDYATVKYNASGEEQWVARYNGPGNLDDAAKSLAVDAMGNVYVTGGTDYDYYYSRGGDYATIKYSASGVAQWVARYGGWGETALILRRKLADGLYEAFQLDKHAWRFGNNSTLLWPHSWWSQFDYTTYPYNTWPWIFADPPINAIPENFPDWPLFVDAFGEDQCYFDPPPGLVIYKPSAIAFWIALKEVLSGGSGWNGSCAGFAISTFAAFDDKALFLQKFPGVGDFDNLYDLDINDERRKAINQLWIHQFGLVQLSTDYLFGNFKSPIQTVNEIKDMFLSETRDDKYLVLLRLERKPPIAHAVNPYKVVKDLSAPNIEYIYVYDNNHSNNADKKIEINMSDNTWKYTEVDTSRFDKGLFLAGPAKDYLNIPILPSRILFDPFKFTAEQSNTNNHLLFFNTPNASITITDPNGREIGYSDSVAFNNFDDGIPIIPMTSRFQPPIGYFIPKRPYTIQMRDFTNSRSYFSVFADSVVYSYSRPDVLLTQTDHLTYGDGLSIKNSDNQAKDIWLESIIVENDHEKVFQTNHRDVSQGDSLRFDVIERRELNVLNFGSPKKYDLVLTLASENGEAIFEHEQIALSENTSHVISPNWEDLENEPVQIFIDEDLDGAIDDTIMVGNEVTGVEDNNSPSRGIPTDYFLAQNYPNPFNAVTRISFGLPKASKVKIEVYSILGQRLIVLLDAWKPAGSHTLKFDAGELTSGLYFYRIQSDKFIKVRRMLLMK